MSITSRAPRRVNFASNSTDPTVGPGSYEHGIGIIAKDDSPFPFMTTQERFRGNPNENPGPADYTPAVPRIEIHGTGALMRSATPRQSFQIGEAPSPANYQHLKNWENDTGRGGRGRRAPMSSRSPRPFLEIPRDSKATCADYDLRPGYKQGVRIAKSARGAFYDHVNTPGPGAYNVAGKRRQGKDSLPSHEFLSSAERRVFNDKPLVDYDGRGQTEWVKAKGSAPFGSKMKGRNIWQLKKTPGPGQYEVESGRRHRKNSAPFGIRGPREWVSPNDNPGPGAYKTGKKRSAKDDIEHPFGHRSPRFAKVYRDNPNGPGQYEVDTTDILSRTRTHETASPSFKHSAQRSAFIPNIQAPGPGEYSPEVGADMTDSRKLRRCIDGTERAKPGTFIGNRISDAPGPAAYLHDKKEPRTVGGYIPHSPRGSIVRNTCAPSPERYHTENDMRKVSLNVTYSVCK